MQKPLTLLTLLFLPLTAHAQQSDLASQLKSLPNISNIQPIAARGTRGTPASAPAANAPESLSFTFTQPIDHTNPALGTFQQHVFISSTGLTNPVVLNTEGYSASGPGTAGELRAILGTPNSITVEHRFFGNSIPTLDGKTPWKFLTVKNAADDMHAVVSELKTLYKGKWISTGTSKGGQTALFYKCYYPDDVDATVAYVAPINIGQEDPRINIFINTVGDDATRQKIKDFQIAMFKREDELLPLLNLQPPAYSILGPKKAYEYAILEYPYAFWQYGTKPAAIPAPDAPAQTLTAHFRQVNTLQYYADAGIKRFQASIYQDFTEIGYYNYDIADFKQYMTAFSFKNGDTPTNLDITPPGTKDQISFNPQTMAFVFNFLQYHADNILYIYGETDAWSATQMQLLGRTNSLKIIVDNASHNAKISAASPQQKTQIYNALDQWLNTKVNRP